MKKLLFLLLLLPSIVFSQGIVSRLQKFELPPVITPNGSSEAYVNKFTVNDTVTYKFIIIQMSPTFKFSSVSYEELANAVKALDSFKLMAVEDLKTNGINTENKFETENGFAIGYSISNNKLKWFMFLNKDTKDRAIYFDDPEKILNILNTPLKKIEELKRL